MDEVILSSLSHFSLSFFTNHVTGNWTDSFRQPHRVTGLRMWTRGWKWFTRLSTNRARTSRINYTDRLISSRNSLGRVGRGIGCCTVVVTRGDRTAGRISGAFARGRFRLAGSGTHRRERTLALSPSLSLASGCSTPIALTRCITGSARYRTALIRRTHTQPMTHTNTRGTHTVHRTRTRTIRCPPRASFLSRLFCGSSKGSNTPFGRSFHARVT